MTRANDICCWSSTGGTGDLTMSAVTSGLFAQSPQFSDVWGTGSPDPWVEYHIIEYADATLMTTKQSESGVCPLHSGVTLKRSAGKLFKSYVSGTGVTPSAGTLSAPTNISFGTTAANIRIFSGAADDALAQVPKVFNATNAGTGSAGNDPGPADLLGRPCGNYNIISGGFPATLIIVANTLYLFPFLWTEHGTVQKFTIDVFSGSSSGNLARAGIYEDDGSGWAGKLIVDMVAAGGTAWNTSATGLITSTITTAINLTPGSKWLAFIANDTPQIQSTHTPQLHQGGTYKTATIHSAQKTVTYGALPSTAPASSGFEYFTVQQACPLVLLK